MNAVIKPAPAAAIAPRFPALPLGGLAGTSFKHEHLAAILAAALLSAGAFNGVAVASSRFASPRAYHTRSFLARLTQA